MEFIVSILTLTLMEIVLGIDNIIFISIVADRLPENQQKKARTIGLTLALVMRVLLLLAITWIIGSTEPLFNVFDQDVSIRDLILIGGGLFLLAKSTTEIHAKLEGAEEEHGTKKAYSSMSKVITQIILLDLVFSFDSILTAIGLAKDIWIMVVAVVVAMIVMLIFATRISNFINKHPSVKMLALSFLLLIGFMLILEGIHIEVPKGYIYFAIFFSLFVELLNMRSRKKTQPVHLRNPGYEKEEEAKSSN